MRTVLGGVAVFAAAVSAFAMPGAMRVGGQTLAAAICGVRDTLWIEHYAAVLYLPGKASAAIELADPQRPKALRMRIMDPRLMPREIPSKWHDPLARHLDAGTLSRAQRAYRTLRRGDRLTLAYRPDAGVTLRVNRRLVATAPGHELIDAILETWADGEPLPTKLRQVLARNPCTTPAVPEKTGVAGPYNEAGTAFARVMGPS